MCVSPVGRVVDVHEAWGVATARVAFPNSPDQVCLSYVDGVAAGDRVRVAGGAIIERVSAEEAAEAAALSALLLDALREIQQQAEE